MAPVFSILGDSISTFAGVSIPGHMVFYDTYTQRRAGLRTADDTWWMQVIAARGGRLGVNCSGAGTLICGLGAACGALLGVGLSLLQQHFGLIEIPAETLLAKSYPVEFRPGDLLAVLVAFGLVAYVISNITVRSMVKHNA